MPFPAPPVCQGLMPEPAGELTGAARDRRDRAATALVLGPLLQVNPER